MPRVYIRQLPYSRVQERTAHSATRLRRVQLRILKRAFELLRPGGKMVYSTCSLNPIENEAVVSAALAGSPDVSLVDVSDRLPHLNRRPGMLHWKVLKRDLSGELADPSSVPNVDSKRYPSSLWPDGKEAERHLERCLRIYPHLQDTGGFFVAVLEKRAADSTVAEAAEAEAEASEEILDAVMAVESAVNPDSGPAAQASTAPVNGDSTKRPRSGASTPKSAKKLKGSEPEGSVDDALPHANPGDAVVEAGGAATALETPAGVPDDLKPATAKSAEKGKGFKEDPYTFLSPNDEQVRICVYAKLSHQYTCRDGLMVLDLVTSSSWTTNSRRRTSWSEMRPANPSGQFTLPLLPFDTSCSATRTRGCGLSAAASSSSLDRTTGQVSTTHSSANGVWSATERLSSVLSSVQRAWFNAASRPCASLWTGKNCTRNSTRSSSRHFGTQSPGCRRAAALSTYNRANSKAPWSDTQFRLASGSARQASTS